MKKTKRCLVISAVIVGLMLGLLIVIPSFIDINRYRPALTDIISKKLNRTVTIQDIRLSFITGLSVIGNSVTIADPRNPDRPFISVPEIKVTCAVVPLIFGDLTIRHIILKEPVITLVDYGDGTLNTDGPGTTKEETGAPETPKTPDSGGGFLPIRQVLIKSVVIREGVFSYLKERESRTEETRVSLTGIDLDIDSIRIPTTTAPNPGHNPLADLGAEIEAEIAEGMIFTVPFADPSLSGSLDGGTATIDRLVSDIFGGTLSTNGTIPIAKGRPNGMLILSLSKADINELLNSLSGQKDAMWGTLDLTGNYTFPINGFNPGLEGTGNVSLTNGYIKDFSLRDELARTLNVPPEVLTAELDTGDYDFIGGDYVIRSGRVSSDHLTATGPVFTAVCAGYVGFDTTLDLAGTITLNKAAPISSIYTEALSLIGISGILESSPFKVTGTFDDARFSISLLGGTERGITDILKGFGIDLGK